MTQPHHQPYPPKQPGRGVSGLAACLIAVVALGAGCLGGVAIAGPDGTAAEAAPAPTVTETAQAKAPAGEPAAAKPAAKPAVEESTEENAGLPEPQVDEPAQVKLPDFTGQNAAVAQEWLVDHGWDEYEEIKLGSQDEYDTFVILPENWTVTKQSHRAGTKVKVGTTIVLTCTKN
ncbi:PASTA domain-containing protein [Planomonospora corallina]|uniref:PASTA domain-containing protein n=1 Tax=Planomonospora corallina TaxID=1806052 RepID=A0ABV8IFQ3_9ACTN